VRRIDPQEAELVGLRLLQEPDKWLLQSAEIELGQIVAEARPELFEEILDDGAI